MKIPRHVAIIMDGNGRWAQRRGHPRVYGHVRGASRVRPIVLEANRLGIRALTLYAFSTENWTRPESELQILWRLLRKYLRREAENLHRHNVRFHVIGEIERLDPALKSEIAPAIEKMSSNTGLWLNFAISYGSRHEISSAARKITELCAQGKMKSKDIDAETLNRELFTGPMGDLSDVDLVIRTSGEKRISNFLLWQAAYAEYVFTDTCWPDFGPEHLRAAVGEFAARERRFGGIDARTV